MEKKTKQPQKKIGGNSQKKTEKMCLKSFCQKQKKEKMTIHLQKKKRCYYWWKEKNQKYACVKFFVKTPIPIIFFFSIRASVVS